MFESYRLPVFAVHGEHSFWMLIVNAWLGTHKSNKILLCIVRCSKRVSDGVQFLLGASSHDQFGTKFGELVAELLTNCIRNSHVEDAIICGYC